ncbi:MAG: hypothetical protein WAM60_07480, partial [Candidatus Promineifilaceae bacterium]
MTQKSKNWLWVILGVVATLGMVSVYLFYLNRQTIVPVSWGNVAGTRNSFVDWLNTFQQSLVTPVATAVLGILIVRRHPQNQIGRLLLIIAFLNSLLMFVGEWSVYGYFTASVAVPGRAWAAWVANWIWIVLFAALLYLVGVFPTGQFISRRWRRVLVGMLLWFAVPFLIASSIEQELSSAYLISNPLPITAPPVVYETLFTIGLPSMPVIAIILVISAVVRFRRGQGQERQQMKWLLAGVSLMAFMVVAGLALSFGAGSVLGDVFVNSAIIGPILGIGVALLRYRLYDIDIIIRRTLVYGVVSALLAT